MRNSRLVGNYAGVWEPAVSIAEEVPPRFKFKAGGWDNILESGCQQSEMGSCRDSSE